MEIEKLKQIMKNKKITYLKLANATGLSVSTITKIFGGYYKNPRIDTMIAIEKALDVYETNFTYPYFTEQEEKLIELWRQLPETRQKAVLLSMQDMVDLFTLKKSNPIKKVLETVRRFFL